MDKRTHTIEIVLGVIVILFLLAVGTANWRSPVASLPASLQPDAVTFQAARGALKNYAIVVVLLLALVMRAHQAVAYLVLSFGVVEAGGLILYVAYSYPLDPLWIVHIINGLVFIPAGVYLVRKSRNP